MTERNLNLSSDGCRDIFVDYVCGEASVRTPAVSSQGGLGSLTALLAGGRPAVTPEQAQQIAPEQVRELAGQAQKHGPSIIDKASDFYAQHPTLVKSLGAGALALIMSHLSQRH